MDVIVSAPRAAIFAGQPVRNATGVLVGAILVGDYLDDRAVAIKSSIHDDVTFYDSHGNVLSSSLAVTADQWSSLSLDQPTRNRVTATSVVELSRTTGGPGVELLAPWTAHGSNLGYVGTISSSAGLLEDTGQLRLIMTILFLGGVLLTLLIGIWLARRITRPVQRLVERHSSGQRRRPRTPGTDHIAR